MRPPFNRQMNMSSRHYYITSTSFGPPSSLHCCFLARQLQVVNSQEALSIKFSITSSQDLLSECWLSHCYPRASVRCILGVRPCSLSRRTWEVGGKNIYGQGRGLLKPRCYLLGKPRQRTTAAKIMRGLRKSAKRIGGVVQNFVQNRVAFCHF